MKLNKDSVNITPQDLIENAVRLLVDSEDWRAYPNDHLSSMTRIAQGYLTAAAVMTSAELSFIDLGERPRFN